MTEKTFISKEHSRNMPFIRIKRIVLQNFKSVGYGEITFNCGNEFVPYETESDILGIYGQNGSGKTALIEALYILKELMSGKPVPNDYADCVALDKPYSTLEFVFDLQYLDERIREVTYSFKMSKESISIDETEQYQNNKLDGFTSMLSKEKAVIFDEKISLVWEGASKKQVIIDTSASNTPFSPETKRKEITGNDKKTLVSLLVKKDLAKAGSRSFVFLSDTLSIFEEYDSSSVYFEVLVELRNYARHDLYVIDTKSSGFIRLNLAIPVYTRDGRMMFDTKEPEIIPNSILNDAKRTIDNISSVLEQLVPGLAIGLKKLTSTLDKNGNPATLAMLVAYRDGKELPLRDESDGVRKILSVLSLIIAAFNQPSVTVAIDEFDAGIFEYLLGEILQAMEESGEGQFIFTSHNLRPLEVIDRKFICFTTTDPENRYTRLKPIAETNNLRDTFLREILLAEQKEEIYHRTKRYKIISAIQNAGGDNE